MATQADIAEDILHKKLELEETSLTTGQFEKTVHEYFPVEVKKYESQLHENPETRECQAESETKKVASSVQAEVTNNVVNGNSGTIEDESFLTSPSGPAISDNQASEQEDCRVDELIQSELGISETVKHLEKGERIGAVEETARQDEVIEEERQEADQVDENRGQNVEVILNQQNFDDEGSKSAEKEIKDSEKDERAGELEESHAELSSKEIATAPEVNLDHKHVQSIAETCPEEENADNTSRMEATFLKKEYTEEKIFEETKGEDKCVDLVPEGKSFETICSSDNRGSKDEKNQTRDTAGDASLSTKALSHDESQTHESGESVKDEVERITVGNEPVDQEAGVTEKKKHEEVPVPASSKHANELSRQEKDEAPIETEMQDKNGSVTPFTAKAEEAFSSPEVNSPEILKLSSETKSEHNAKEIPIEVTSKTEILGETIQVKGTASGEANGNESYEKEPDISSRNIEEEIHGKGEGMDITKVAVEKAQQTEGSSHVAAEDVTTIKLSQAEELTKVESTKHEDHPDDDLLLPNESEEEKFQTHFNVVSEEIENVTLRGETPTVTSTKEEGEIKSLDESFEENEKREQPIPTCDVRGNESSEEITKSESTEAELPGNNASDSNASIFLVEQAEVQREKIGEVSEVGSHEKDQTSDEAPEKEKEHVEAESEGYRSTEKTIVTSTEGIAPTDIISKECENTKKTETDYGVSSKRSFESQVAGENESEEIKKEAEVTDLEVQKFTSSQESKETSTLDDIPAKVDSTVREIPEEEAAKPIGEDESHNQESIVADFNKEQISEREVACSTPESVQEGKSKSSDDNVKDAEKLNEEESHTEIIKEGNISNLSLENIKEDATEKLKDHEHEAEKSKEEVVEGLETVGAGEIIPSETNKDIERIVDASSTKQEDSQHEEVKYLDQTEASTKESKVEIAEEEALKLRGEDEDHTQESTEGNVEKEQIIERDVMLSTPELVQEEISKSSQDKINEEESTLEIIKEGKLDDLSPQNAQEDSTKTIEDRENEVEKSGEEIVEELETTRADESIPCETNEDIESFIDDSSVKQEEVKEQDPIKASIEENKVEISEEEALESKHEDESHRQEAEANKEQITEEDATFSAVEPIQEETSNTSQDNAKDVEKLNEEESTVESIPENNQEDEINKLNDHENEAEKCKEEVVQESVSAGPSERILFETNKDVEKFVQASPIKQEERQQEEVKYQDPIKATTEENKVETPEEEAQKPKGEDGSHRQERTGADFDKEQLVERDVTFSTPESIQEETSERSGEVINAEHSAEITKEGNISDLSTENIKEDATEVLKDHENEVEKSKKEVVEELETTGPGEHIPCETINKDVERSEEASSVKQEEEVKYLDPTGASIEENTLKIPEEEASKSRYDDESQRQENAGAEFDRQKITEREVMFSMPVSIQEETSKTSQDNLKDEESTTEITKEGEINNLSQKNIKEDVIETLKDKHETQKSKEEVKEELETDVAGQSISCETTKNDESSADVSSVTKEEGRQKEGEDESQKQESTDAEKINEEPPVEITKEGSRKELSPENTEEGTIEALKDNETEVENSKEEVVHELETAGLSESIPCETNEDVESSVEASSVKQEESQQEEERGTELALKGNKDQQQAMQDKPEEKLEDSFHVLLEETKAEKSSEIAQEITSIEAEGTIQNLKEASEKEKEGEKSKNTDDANDSEKETPKEIDTEGAGESIPCEKNKEAESSVDALSVKQEERQQEEVKDINQAEASTEESKIEEIFTAKAVEDDEEIKASDASSKGEEGQQQATQKDEPEQKLENLLHEKPKEMETETSIENARSITYAEVEETTQDLEETSVREKTAYVHDTNDSAEAPKGLETPEAGESSSFKISEDAESSVEASSVKQEESHEEEVKYNDHVESLTEENKVEDSYSTKVDKVDDGSKVKVTEKEIEVESKDEEDQQQALQKDEQGEKLEDWPLVTPEQTVTKPLSKIAREITYVEAEETVQHLDKPSETENEGEKTKNVDGTNDLEKEIPKELETTEANDSIPHNINEDAESSVDASSVKQEESQEEEVKHIDQDKALIEEKKLEETSTTEVVKEDDESIVSDVALKGKEGQRQETQKDKPAQKLETLLPEMPVETEIETSSEIARNITCMGVEGTAENLKETTEVEQMKHVDSTNDSEKEIPQELETAGTSESIPCKIDEDVERSVATSLAMQEEDKELEQVEASKEENIVEDSFSTEVVAKEGDDNKVKVTKREIEEDLQAAPQKDEPGEKLEDVLQVTPKTAEASESCSGKVSEDAESSVDASSVKQKESQQEEAKNIDWVESLTEENKVEDSYSTEVDKEDDGSKVEVAEEKIEVELKDEEDHQHVMQKDEPGEKLEDLPPVTPEQTETEPSSKIAREITCVEVEETVQNLDKPSEIEKELEQTKNVDGTNDSEKEIFKELKTTEANDSIPHNIKEDAESFVDASSVKHEESQEEEVKHIDQGKASIEKKKLEETSTTEVVKEDDESKVLDVASKGKEDQKQETQEDEPAEKLESLLPETPVETEIETSSEIARNISCMGVEGSAEDLEETTEVEQKKHVDRTNDSEKQIPQELETAGTSESIPCKIDEDVERSVVTSLAKQEEDKELEQVEALKEKNKVEDSFSTEVVAKEDNDNKVKATEREIEEDLQPAPQKDEPREKLEDVLQVMPKTAEASESSSGKPIEDAESSVDASSVKQEESQQEEAKNIDRVESSMEENKVEDSYSTEVDNEDDGSKVEVAEEKIEGESEDEEDQQHATQKDELGEKLEDLLHVTPEETETEPSSKFAREITCIEVEETAQNLDKTSETENEGEKTKNADGTNDSEKEIPKELETTGADNSILRKIIDDAESSVDASTVKQEASQEEEVKHIDQGKALIEGKKIEEASTTEVVKDDGESIVSNVASKGEQEHEQAMRKDEPAEKLENLLPETPLEAETETSTENARNTTDVDVEGTAQNLEGTAAIEKTDHVASINDSEKEIPPELETAGTRESIPNKIDEDVERSVVTSSVAEEEDKEQEQVEALKEENKVEDSFSAEVVAKEDDDSNVKVTEREIEEDLQPAPQKVEQGEKLEEVLQVTPKTTGTSESSSGKVSEDAESSVDASSVKQEESQQEEAKNIDCVESSTEENKVEDSYFTEVDKEDGGSKVEVAEEKTEVESKDEEDQQPTMQKDESGEKLEDLLHVTPEETETEPSSKFAREITCIEVEETVQNLDKTSETENEGEKTKNADSTNDLEKEIPKELETTGAGDSIPSKVVEDAESCVDASTVKQEAIQEEEVKHIDQGKASIEEKKLEETSTTEVVKDVESKASDVASKGEQDHEQAMRKDEPAEKLENLLPETPLEAETETSTENARNATDVDVEGTAQNLEGTMAIEKTDHVDSINNSEKEIPPELETAGTRESIPRKVDEDVERSVVTSSVAEEEDKELEQVEASKEENKVEDSCSAEVVAKEDDDSKVKVTEREIEEDLQPAPQKDEPREKLEEVLQVMPKTTGASESSSGKVSEDAESSVDASSVKQEESQQEEAKNIDCVESSTEENKVEDSYFTEVDKEDGGSKVEVAEEKTEVESKDEEDQQPTMQKDESGEKLEDLLHVTPEETETEPSSKFAREITCIEVEETVQNLDKTSETENEGEKTKNADGTNDLEKEIPKELETTGAGDGIPCKIVEDAESCVDASTVKQEASQKEEVKHIDQGKASIEEKKLEETSTTEVVKDDAESKVSDVYSKGEQDHEQATQKDEPAEKLENLLPETTLETETETSTENARNATDIDVEGTAQNLKETAAVEKTEHVDSINDSEKEIPPELETARTSESIPCKIDDGVERSVVTSLVAEEENKELDRVEASKEENKVEDSLSTKLVVKEDDDSKVKVTEREKEEDTQQAPQKDEPGEKFKDVLQVMPKETKTETETSIGNATNISCAEGEGIIQNVEDSLDTENTKNTDNAIDSGEIPKDLETARVSESSSCKISEDAESSVDASSVKQEESQQEELKYIDHVESSTEENKVEDTNSTEVDKDDDGNKVEVTEKDVEVESKDEQDQQQATQKDKLGEKPEDLLHVMPEETETEPSSKIAREIFCLEGEETVQSLKKTSEPENEGEKTKNVDGTSNSEREVPETTNASQETKEEVSPVIGSLEEFSNKRTDTETTDETKEELVEEISKEAEKEETGLKDGEPENEERLKSYDINPEDKRVTSSVDSVSIASEETWLKEEKPDDEEKITSSADALKEKGLESGGDSVSTEIVSEDTGLKESKQDDVEQIKSYDAALEEKGVSSSIDIGAESKAVSTGILSDEARLKEAETEEEEKVGRIESEERSSKEAELKTVEQVKSYELAPEEKGLASNVTIEEQSDPVSTEILSADVAIEESLASSLDTEILTEETSLKEAEAGDEEHVQSADLALEKEGLVSDVEVEAQSASISAETKTEEAGVTEANEEQVRSSNTALKEKSLVSSLDTEIVSEETTLKEVKSNYEEQVKDSVPEKESLVTYVDTKTRPESVSADVVSEGTCLKEDKPENEDKIISSDTAPQEESLVSEEIGLKEAESDNKEDVKHSDFCLEEESSVSEEKGLKEVESDDKEEVKIHDSAPAETGVLSNVVGDVQQNENEKSEEKEENKVPEVTRECEEKIVQEVKGETPIAETENKEQDIKAETSLEDLSEDNLQDSSALPSTEDEPVTTEATVRSDETTAVDKAECENVILPITESTKEEGLLQEEDGSKLESDDTEKKIANEESQKQRDVDITTKDALPTEVHEAVEKVAESESIIEQVTDRDINSKESHPGSIVDERVYEENDSGPILTEFGEAQAGADSEERNLVLQKSECEVPQAQKVESVTKLEERSFDLDQVDEKETEEKTMVEESGAENEAKETKLASDTEDVDATRPIPAVEKLETVESKEEIKEASESQGAEAVNKDEITGEQAPDDGLSKGKEHETETTVATEEEIIKDVDLQDNEKTEASSATHLEREGPSGLKLHEEAEERLRKEETEEDIKTAPETVLESNYRSIQSVSKDEVIADQDHHVGVPLEQVKELQTTEVVKKSEDSLLAKKADEKNLKEETEEEIIEAPITSVISKNEVQVSHLEEQDREILSDSSATKTAEEECLLKEEPREIKASDSLTKVLGADETQEETKEVSKTVFESDSQSIGVVTEDKKITRETFNENQSEVQLIDQSYVVLPKEQEDGITTTAKEIEENTTEETCSQKEVEGITEASETLSKENAPDIEVVNRDTYADRALLVDKDENIADQALKIPSSSASVPDERGHDTSATVKNVEEEETKVEVSESGGTKDSPSERDEVLETREAVIEASNLNVEKHEIASDLISEKSESPEARTSIEEVEIIENHLKVATTDVRTEKPQCETTIQAESTTEIEISDKEEQRSSEISEAKSGLDVTKVQETKESLETKTTTTDKDAPPKLTDPVEEETSQTAEPKDIKNDITSVKRETTDVEFKKEECEEKETSGSKTETTPAVISLSELLQSSKGETVQVAAEQSTEAEKAKTDEERDVEDEEEDDDHDQVQEHEHEEGDHPDAPILVQASRDIVSKGGRKKSHGIFSGVGSKVKHSISKVKKAITGKSSHSKTLPSS